MASYRPTTPNTLRYSERIASLADDPAMAAMMRSVGPRCQTTTAATATTATATAAAIAVEASTSQALGLATPLAGGFTPMVSVTPAARRRGGSSKEPSFFSESPANPMPGLASSTTSFRLGTGMSLQAGTMRSRLAPSAVVGGAAYCSPQASRMGGASSSRSFHVSRRGMGAAGGAAVSAASGFFPVGSQWARSMAARAEAVEAVLAAADARYGGEELETQDEAPDVGETARRAPSGTNEAEAKADVLRSEGIQAIECLVRQRARAAAPSSAGAAASAAASRRPWERAPPRLPSPPADARPSSNPAAADCREEMDRVLRRLLGLVDLARGPLPEAAAQRTLCEQLDRVHNWYQSNSSRTRMAEDSFPSSRVHHKPHPCQPAPPYLRVDEPPLFGDPLGPSSGSRARRLGVSQSSPALRHAGSAMVTAGRGQVSA